MRRVLHRSRHAVRAVPRLLTAAVRGLLAAAWEERMCEPEIMMPCSTSMRSSQLWMAILELSKAIMRFPQAPCEKFPS